MASKDKTTLPTSQTTTSTTEETTVPLSSDRDLAGITASATGETGQRAEVVQKAQVSPDTVKGKLKDPVKEKQSSQKTSPSPATCTCKYTLEVWIKVEVSPGVYAYPEDDAYSADFVMDTLNLAYPGCMGVYLTDAGHLVAFYGKKTKPVAGLSLKQGMEACRLVAEIPTWMRNLVKYTVCAISTNEVQELVQGLKWLEKIYVKFALNLVTNFLLYDWDRLIVAYLPPQNLLFL